MSCLAQSPISSPDYWPFVVLLISVTVIVLLITVMRVHAFLALILAAFTAGLLAHSLPGEPEKAHWVQAVELTTAEFGLTAGKIGEMMRPTFETAGASSLSRVRGTRSA